MLDFLKNRNSIIFPMKNQNVNINIIFSRKSKFIVQFVQVFLEYPILFSMTYFLFYSALPMISVKQQACITSLPEDDERIYRIHCRLS